MRHSEMCQINSRGYARARIFTPKKDMQKVNVPILGLTSNSEARAVRDGECMVLHNLTVEEGGVKVIAPPSETAGKANEYYHASAGQWLYISDAGIVVRDNGVVVNEDGVVSSLEFMGNLVVMYCSDGVRYAVYDGNYRYLGRLPKPKLDISIETKQTTILTENKYYVKDLEDTESAENRALQWKNNSKGFFDKCLRGLYEKGAFVDRTMIRVAARLFDGSYVAYSPIYYVEDSDDLVDVLAYDSGAKAQIGRDEMNFVSRPKYLNGRMSLFYASVRGFVPTFSMPDLKSSPLTRWRDVIVGFDVFASASVMGHESNDVQVEEDERYIKANTKAENVNVTLSSLTNYDMYVPKSAAKIRTEVSETSLFYKVAEFDLSGNLVWQVEDTSPSRLAVQKSLPMNECPHDMAGGYRYVYNNKLHLAGVEEVFSDAYSDYRRVGHEGEVIHQITTVVDIATGGKSNKVITTVVAPKLDVKSLSPLLHYPDSRAKSMTVYVSYGSTVKKRTFPLTAHLTLNEAYFLADAVESSYNVDERFIAALKPDVRYQKDYSGSYGFSKDGSGKWTLRVALTDGTTMEIVDVNPLDYGIEPGDGSVAEQITVIKSGRSGIAAIDVTKWEGVTSDEITLKADGTFSLKNVSESRKNIRGNVMRVSEVDNPIFFPARFTYSFGDDIVAICSNTIAVSQGQFGQYPLYVFTKGGVWLMSVDASGGSYSSQVPCSREICSNGAGVSAAASGVVFPTDMGLMLMNGAEVVDISQAIAGFKGIAGGGVVEEICGLVGKNGLTDRASFVDYLNGAFTAYDYNTRLLYVCNAGYDYVYAYNMVSGAWSTVDGKYSRYIPYPGRLVLAGDKRYTFDRYNQLVDVPVVMVSRGCIFGETGFKRVAEAALRGTVFSNRSCFYVLGSVDGVQWSVICGKERLSEEADLLRDFVTHFKRSRSYRFISFAFVGGVRSDARLLMCEIGVEAAWGNRLR